MTAFVVYPEAIIIVVYPEAIIKGWLLCIKTTDIEIF